MLLRSSPSAVTSYLKHRSEAGTPDALDKTQLFWTGVLTSTASYASSLPTLLDQAGSVKALLASVLSAAEEGSLPAHLRGASGAMDAQLFKLLGYGVKCQPEAIVEGLLDNLLSVYSKWPHSFSGMTYTYVHWQSTSFHRKGWKL